MPYSSTNEIKPTASPMTVFVILTTTWLPTARVYSIYATREAAEAKAAELRTQVYGDWTDELEFEHVEVIEQQVLN
jgi:hypothetical protein